VLFLDADNHLLDVSNMDEDVCKMDVVQDYVKACKKYSRIHKVPVSNTRLPVSCISISVVFGTFGL